MNLRFLYIRFVVAMLLLVAVSSCRTCPIVSCHTRKQHFHDGTKFRGQPFFKKQIPAIGEKIKVHNEGNSKRRKADKSKPLK